MTISYHWLCEYLPDRLSPKPSPDQLSKILTSVGLEVESLTKFESVKGLLEGLVTGEVLQCDQHPNADKLKITMVNAGGAEPLQIVCGAPNVAVGQKVIVALPGTTIYPENGEPITIKATSIRGVPSLGMICAEDEIGLGKSHAGIIILPDSVRPGLPAASHFKPYTDHLFEIGLTPNHMDAMSHIGVARDVCAYLSQHSNKDYRVKLPSVNDFVIQGKSLPVSVQIENKKACGRYSGISIKGITIRDSPKWMQDKLKAIGIRPISNVVDITNYILHETGQPLHAFDADAVKGNKIIVKNLPAGTHFVTLDGKERKLDAEDLMICNAEEGMCIAGVFGGLASGIKAGTKNLFLESAWFNPSSIRKTSFRHGLRTDAAIHFEKGMDISNTVFALKRAALLIREIAGGETASDIVDVYPLPEPKHQIILKYHYLKKLSGKNYHPDAIKTILTGLGFDILREGMDDLLIAVPYHKRDIQMPADVVEEIMRIDGYDNIEIPSSITISPSIETGKDAAARQEKIAAHLAGLGFSEIFTNSITNSAYYSEEELAGTVKMINSLSTELNIMRPSLLETGLECIAWNINRKNEDLRFFEFGKSYAVKETGIYTETNHLSLYITGQLSTDTWKGKKQAFDFYYLKGVCSGIFRQAGIAPGEAIASSDKKFSSGLSFPGHDHALLEAGIVDPALLKRFDIRQPVFFADFNWDLLLAASAKTSIHFTELPKQLPVSRDLALIVKKTLPYAAVEQVVKQIGLNKLQSVELFDIFESDKLGSDKKSLAVSFAFMDPEKTLTDKEIDGMMGRIMKAVEQELAAEIRK